ncbi:flagellar basal-body rod protein FlgG [Granulicella pectinivorans]|jgi:flagellar basal-body rod protein FlgG|uniref:Flagellar basal-body rod protein FlgG n=1 Tax=Granulicella pectinivorans TaxID=474950 RepID=A0A1I6MSW5_9BACT|nr:flagellar basal-body rod protein FlgG [Granulicella pectinivorans]SFS18721.1 flagellar basal-body rod protein FlgG [Granulicella pectinivorans]
MIRALYTAASGMSAQQANLDTVANNLANSATAGFRRRRLQFEDMIYQNVITPGAAQSQQTASAGLQIGLGTRSAATEVIMSQGDFNQTGNPLDLAIQGQGFFQVQRPDGTTAYTRSGNFHMNNQGTIVTADGDQVLPAITIPTNATNVTISSYGVVTATIPGQTTSAQLGTVQLATFANPGGLNSIGGNLFLQSSSSGNAITEAPGGSAGLGTLQQGYLENSNVDVVAEFVQMILAQRAYESNSKVVHVADDMYSQINNMVR